MSRKTRYNNVTKEKAEELRRKGLSYKQLWNALKIPKSTLSAWFSKKIPGIFDRKKTTTTSSAS